MWWRTVKTHLKESLGEGSQGRVFKALRVDQQTQLTQTVAVKVLHSKTAVELWTKEFESLHRVRSPYCVQVLSFERVRGRPALILEYIDGISITELARAGFLRKSEVVEIATQIEQGLLDLSEQGVFHGDLSPHNVMVDIRGRVRLLDFGLANGSGRRLRVTPEFAAPERRKGATATLASDLYSLGRLEQLLGEEGSSYLQVSPSDRLPRFLKPNPESQESLARTVRAAMEWKKRLASIQTRTQATTLEPNTRSIKAVVMAALMLCASLATSGATQTTRARIGSLTVRTHAWYYIIIDDSPVGYAPLSIPLRAGVTHQLKWTSSSAHGQRALRVEPDQALELSDRDFAQ